MERDLQNPPPLLSKTPGVLLPLPAIPLLPPHLSQEIPPSPSPAWLLPMEARLIFGELTACSSSVPGFLCSVWKRGNKQAQPLARKLQICGSLVVPKDPAQASEQCTVMNEG